MKIGLLVNPIAGLGGAVALKGSDGAALQEQARKREGSARGPARVGVFLQHLRLLDEEERAAAKTLVPQVQWCTWGGAMGADYLEQYGLNHTVLGNYQGDSDAADTIAAVTEFIQQGVDLIIFVGGDGTARDVLSAATEATSVWVCRPELKCTVVYLQFRQLQLLESLLAWLMVVLLVGCKEKFETT